MSSKSLKITDTYVNAVHFLPNGTQWTGDVHYHSEEHPSPEGYVGFMTGAEHTSGSTRLTTFPTLIEYPESYDPATSGVLDLVFKDLEASGAVGEVEIKTITSAIRVLNNTINISKQSIESAVQQIIGAVDTNINQTEENGTGLIEDTFYEDVLTLEAVGINNYSSNVSSIVFESTTGEVNGSYLFHGNAETFQENDGGWEKMLSSHITVDLISRVNSLAFDEILDMIQEGTGLELLSNDFRYIPSSVDEGFSGVLKVQLDQSVPISHLKLLFGTFIDITSIKVNDDSQDMWPVSFYVFRMSSEIPVYNINIYFQYSSPQSFSSSITINELNGEFYIVDHMGYLFGEPVETIAMEEGVQPGDEATSSSTDSGGDEGGGY